MLEMLLASPERLLADGHMCMTSNLNPTCLVAHERSPVHQDEQADCQGEDEADVYEEGWLSLEADEEEDDQAEYAAK